jgi:hypothetical protein
MNLREENKIIYWHGYFAEFPPLTRICMQYSDLLAVMKSVR